MERCTKCGAEILSGQNFCINCGERIIQKCRKCGSDLPINARFCPVCGTNQLAINDTVDNDSGISMGDKNVIAGDVIGRKETYQVSGNATFVNNHDETKKVVTCSVCGRNLGITEGSYNCPVCNKLVCVNCYDSELKLCINCAVPVRLNKNKQSERNFKIGKLVEKAMSEGFIFVEGSSFYIGDDSHPDFHNPRRPIGVKSFLISQFELSQEEYRVTVGTDPSLHKAFRHPVENLSWYEAIVFCNLFSLNKKVEPCYYINGSADPSEWGKIPVIKNDKWDGVVCDFSKNGYRLPTEEEWEYAAKGGKNQSEYQYSGSDNLNDIGWYNGNSGNVTHELGSKRPNCLGLYDMTGNVWEWCWNWFDQNKTHRVARGGSYIEKSDWCSNSNRGLGNPYSKLPYAGLRLVRSVEI